MQDQSTSATFEMVAKTFQGLEDVLADELMALGAQDVAAGRRMVSFSGDKRLLYQANLCLRTALRVLKPIAKFSAANPDELYDHVRDFEWDTLLSPEQTFSIDSTVNSREFPHSKFVTYRVKDAIADYFTEKYGRRPSVSVTAAHTQLNVHIFDDRVTISLDSSGEPLSRRGYRTEHTEAPLNEVLAAGIIMKSGWKGECDLVDPMCGSGTFLIEGALIAAGINPGIFRQHFAFENWPDFDADLFEELYNDDSGERTPSCRILGGDIAREAVEISRANIKRAGVEDFVSVECKPMQDWTEPPLDGILFTNPPYGERLRPGDLEGLYKALGRTLKHSFTGYTAYVLGYRDQAMDEIGLKASEKYPILNGKLECQVRQYVLFAGSYDALRQKGGHIKDPDKQGRGEAPKVKHLSDREWRRSTSGGKDPRHSQAKDARKAFRSDDRKERPKAKSAFKGKPFSKSKDFPKNKEEQPFRTPAPETTVMRKRKGWKTQS